MANKALKRSLGIDLMTRVFFLRIKHFIGQIIIMLALTSIVYEYEYEYEYHSMNYEMYEILMRSDYNYDV